MLHSDMKTFGKLLFAKKNCCAIAALSVIAVLFLINRYVKSNIHFYKDFDPEFQGINLSINGKITDNDLINIIKNFDKIPGLNGTPVILNSKFQNMYKEIIRAGYRDHGFNKFVSDLISVNRTLLDQRDEWCKEQNYSSNLPTVTVIIYVYNEALSVLIRTINSVLKNSPYSLIDNIILVDDNSTMEYLQTPLDKYVSTMPKVKLIRNSERVGMVKARLMHIPQVKSPVVLYLNSHCECTSGWLKPLLQRIKEDPNRVVTPFIDQIDESTFEYIKQETNKLKLGEFTWNLQFIWTDIPEDIAKRRKNSAAPIQTPTIFGENFAISKKFLEKTFFTNLDMETCGLENLELSFKIWMCGGSLEIIPCSHVGSNRCQRKMPCGGSQSKIKQSSVRLAKVWLTEYSKYYFERNGYYMDSGGSNIKLLLREKLHCKSFKWYLDNVYPQQELPNAYAARGQIYIKDQIAMCLDASIAILIIEDSIKLSPCHYQGGSQYWTYTSAGEIRRDNICLDFSMNALTLNVCNKAKSQVWLYLKQGHQIKHNLTNLCLFSFHGNDYSVKLVSCFLKWVKKWFMDNYDHTKLSPKIQKYIIDSGKYMKSLHSIRQTKQ